jgi:glycosyltransferase involved in cell wall biosynthesis
LAGWKLSSWYELNYYQSVNNYSCRTHWDQAIVKRHNPRANVFEIWETIRPEFFIQKKTSKGENILFLGGTQAIKGIDYVLKSYDLIKNQISGKLMIAGNISLNKLHQIIKKYHLDIIIERDIKILGFLGAKDMVENARKSFCLLHPTLIDNSPNSVCESQVIGLPVVATEVGGVSSLIEDGDTGLLANHNCEKIATQVLKLYTDDDLWNYISIKSREVARKRHDPDKIVKQTLKMYEKIINENE